MQFAGATSTPRHEYALDLMLRMPSQRHATGLQTLSDSRQSDGWQPDMLHGDCVGPRGEAARLPRVCPMALGYRLPPL